MFLKLLICFLFFFIIWFYHFIFYIIHNLFSLFSTTAGEISKLEKKMAEKQEPKSTDSERKIFTCSKCKFSSSYFYYGKTPPNAKDVGLLESAYVIKDPFTPDTHHRSFICLGSHCSYCSQPICMDKTCSYFYQKRFCVDCISKFILEFPQQVQNELKKKMLSA